MKYLLFTALILGFACGGTKEQEDDVEWKEMDDFHAVMADVYHPLKDSNNLEPIRKDAGKLANEATTWAQSTLPEKVDNEETKELLASLEDGTEDLARAVKTGDPDSIIAAKLTILHDTFHSIMEKWYEAGKEEGAEEHHDH
jgi:hypothetical protein